MRQVFDSAISKGFVANESDLVASKHFFFKVFVRLFNPYVQPSQTDWQFLLVHVKWVHPVIAISKLDDSLIA
jgi:hypothetical protein